jgi:negative regulator of replication initiation
MPWETCCRRECQSKFWIPDDLHNAALASRGSNGIHFYCAYGHGQHYRIGESEADVLRRERDRLKQDAVRLEEYLAEETKRADKAEREAKRIKKRAATGTCPCCRRSFSNMSDHMRKEHPEFVKEQTQA